MIIQTPFATVKNNELYIDDVRATALAEKYGTPLYVMSEGHIRHQMNATIWAPLKVRSCVQTISNHLSHIQLTQVKTSPPPPSGPSNLLCRQGAA